HRRAHVKQALETADELLGDSFESRPLFLRSTGVGEEVAIVSAATAHGEFVPREAHLAPMFLPGAFPGATSGKTRKPRRGGQSVSGFRHSFVSCQLSRAGFWPLATDN